MPYTHTRYRSRSAEPREPVICIVGVGFVGESLLREFGTRFSAIGFDISETRIEELRKIFKGRERITVTSDLETLAWATHYLIAVPTLLKDDRSIDLSHLVSAVSMVLRYARPGCTIVIESSVSVGTTRKVLGPYKDVYYCGMSPERVDPGRISPTAAEIPKIVSGLTPKACAAIQAVYGQVYHQIVPVSKPEVAEMTKLFENCYRMVNIAYVNEMADAARSHGINPQEMIDAASTKPYGFTAFQTGLGVGGHCIPVNPFYLFANNGSLPVLEKATARMWQRPKRLASSFYRRITTGTEHSNPRILVVGMGFKPGQAVLSCSPGLMFAERLRELGCDRLVFHDPLVDQERISWMEKLDDGNWNPDYIDQSFDAVAICTQQVGIDYTVTKGLRVAKLQQFG
ncbi:UDP-N-acetyl-D-mannosamine 6-dehydrogenase [Saccharata proteae CBS 121410]|uniref:UDP-N-acetyl-D-mannosamine 6-dehydrogenase n=1 Tax=Saccharata proteae CBS 121410 TaxID=1314787 RepID=A0A9P4HYX3_9PEZI|nr:UDP-N-acetyl-D-mannosamine 6-dehydrogenase [Saccharata proteae CBS 121410]